LHRPSYMRTNEPPVHQPFLTASSSRERTERRERRARGRPLRARGRPAGEHMGVAAKMAWLVVGIGVGRTLLTAATSKASRREPCLPPAGCWPKYFVLPQQKIKSPSSKAPSPPELYVELLHRRTRVLESPGFQFPKPPWAACCCDLLSAGPMEPKSRCLN
jgi:hypothetical protein